MATKQFLWKKALWKVAQVVAPLLAGVGIVVAIPESYEAFSEEIILAILSLIVGVLKFVEQRWKHAPEKSKSSGTGKWPGVWIVFLSFSLLASGCASVGVPASMSRNTITLSEKIPSEHGMQTFKLKVDTRGEAATETKFQYTGETENAEQSPWSLEIGNENAITSPQTQILAEGYMGFYNQLPAALVSLAPFLAQLAQPIPLPELGSGALAPTALEVIADAFLKSRRIQGSEP